MVSAMKLMLLQGVLYQLFLSLMCSRITGRLIKTHMTVFFFFFSLSEAFYLYVLYPKNLRVFPSVCFRLGDLTPSVSDFFSLGGFEDFHVKHTIRGYCYCWSGEHTFINTQLDNDLIMPTSHLIQDEIKISQIVAVRNKQPSKLALCLIPKQCL